MTTLVLPVTKCDATDGGVVDAVTAVEDTIALAGGLYKIAAMGQPLLWRIGATAVTASVGSYLAAGDQEVIYIPPPVSPATDIPLRFILAADATGDGEINVVVVNLLEVPGNEPRNYYTPA